MFGNGNQYVTLAHMEAMLVELRAKGFGGDMMLVGVKRIGSHKYIVSLSDGGSGPSCEVEIIEGKAVFTPTGYTMY